MEDLTQEQQQNILETTPWMRDGNQLLIQVTSVAESGLSRSMKVYAFSADENHFNDVTTRVADLLDLPRVDKGLKIRGAGMDMCFSLKNDLEGFAKNKLGVDLALNHKSFTSNETSFLMDSFRGMPNNHNWIIHNEFKDPNNKVKMLQELNAKGELKLENKDVVLSNLQNTLNKAEKPLLSIHDNINLPENEGGISTGELSRLIKYGLDLNQQDLHGDTLFHKLAFKNDFSKAVNQENVKKATILINKGANLLITDNEGYTPIDVANMNNKDDILGLYTRKLNNDLFSNATEGNVPQVKIALNNGADISHEDNACIRFASLFNQWDAVKVLVENGADVNIDNGAVIKSAAEAGNFVMTKYIMERGGNIDDAIREADSSIKNDLIELKQTTNQNHPIESKKQDVEQKR